MRRFIVMAAIAIAVGAMAVWGMRVWVERERVESAEANVVKREVIVVASHDFTVGQKILAEDLQEIDWASGTRPEGAFSRIQDVIAQGEVYAADEIKAFEPLLAHDLTDTLDKLAPSARLRPGRKALTIDLQNVGLAEGMLRAGDHIDILMTHSQSGSGEAYVDVLLQDLTVMAVGSSKKNEAPMRSRSVTLEVTTEEAQILTLAAQTGRTLSFVLRGSGSSEASDPKRVTLSDIGEASKMPEPPPPTAVAPEPPFAEAAAHATTTVGVHRNNGRVAFEVLVAN